MTRTSAPTFRALPRGAQLYIAGLSGVVVAMLVVMTVLPDGYPSLDPSLLVVTLVLCAGANLLEVFAPGHYSFQPNLVFFFWGAVLLPEWAIAALAVACFLPGWIKHRFRWYMVAFNVVNYTLAGLAAHEIVELSGSLAPNGGQTIPGVVALVLAAVTFVVLNLALIAVVVTLARGRPLRESVRDMKNSLHLDLALAMTGACLAALWTDSAALTVLATGPMILVYRALWVPLLEHKSRTDPKTGLSNSEHLDMVFADALAAARKQGTSLSVVMMDLDHLRTVNNARGHLAGDQLLRAAAAEVMALVGQHDTAARFGGDEFCLLLPGKSLPAARAMAERARAAIEALAIPDADGGPPLGTTLSAGIASYPEHGETVNSLVSAADAAVYDAKLGGRNRVRTALPPGTREAFELRELTNGDAPAAVLSVPPTAHTKANSSTAERALSAYRAEPDPEPAAEAPREDPVQEEAVAKAPATRRYIPLVTFVLCLATGVVGLKSSAGPIGAEPVFFGLLVAAFVLLDQARIDLFERANISPAAIPALAIACVFGPLSVIAAEGALALVRATKREPVVKWTFDFGALALAGALAAGVFQWMPTQADLGLLLAGAVAGLAYYLVNASLLAAVMGLAEGKSPWGAWRERLAWLWPHYIFFGMLAGLLVASERELGPAVLGVFAIPLLMVWLAQKQYLERSRSSVAELRRSHEQLEQKNERLRGLLGDNRELLGQMHRSYLSTITSLARTIEAKDPYTGGHTERVAEIALTLARELGFTPTELQAVNVGALIHDIGKIGVPDSVLLKEGPLTDEEFAEIREHPKISSYIVADLELPPIVKQMVRSHHERYDGSGYPDGLLGEEIPLAARILSVADALDAMTSDRPYRDALPVDAARAEIQSKVGEQFCPKVVGALNACMKSQPELWARLAVVSSDRKATDTPPAAGLASV
jgi:diguanylate cyclase (GGDEF)-like protein/putative nucleotidyltransferase with HDIG domain